MRLAPLLIGFLMFQLPALAGALDRYAGATGTILTPNGDGINDRIMVNVENPENLALQSTIYNIRGSKISEMTLISSQKLMWDGKDSSGRVVESGMYICQIAREGSKSQNFVVNVVK